MWIRLKLLISEILLTSRERSQLDKTGILTCYSKAHDHLCKISVKKPMNSRAILLLHQKNMERQRNMLKDIRNFCHIIVALLNMSEYKSKVQTFQVEYWCIQSFQAKPKCMGSEDRPQSLNSSSTTQLYDLYQINKPLINFHISKKHTQKSTYLKRLL